MTRILPALLLGVAFLLMGYGAPAHALSCYGVSDRFFVECANGQCVVAFRARDVPVAGGCARRTLVESPLPGASAVLLNRVASQISTGKFEVTLEHRYYSDPPASAEALEEAFGGHLLRAPRVTLSRLSPDADFGEIRADWEGRARRSTFAWIANWVVEVAALVAALGLVYWTTRTYRARLRRLSPGRLLAPLALQLGLLVVAVLSFAGPTGLFLFVLAVPVLWVAWIYELALYAGVHWRPTAVLKIIASPNAPTALLVICAGTAAVLALAGTLAPRALVPMVIGAGLAGYGTMRLRRAAIAQGWERVPATVVFRGMQQVWDGYPRYRPVVRFEAVVDGRHTQYARFSLDAEDFEGDERDVEEVLQQYTVGGEILVFRDPAPAGGLLVRVDSPDGRRQRHRMCIMAGCGLMVTAVLLATIAP